jgi:hypothetical protein
MPTVPPPDDHDSRRRPGIDDLPRGLGDPDDDGRAAPAAGPRSVLEQLVWDHAARFGWNTEQIKDLYRSARTVIKARKLTFTDPAAKIPTGRPETTDPLLLAPAVVRDVLDSADPARAALGALAAFQTLTCGQLRTLQLTDIHDGRLHQGDRTILLAGPVRARLASYLDHRQRMWPHTASPHLYITQQTALRDVPASDRWIRLKIGMTVRAIREDRILYGAMATGGDERRLGDLFGLSVKGATGYSAAIDHSSFTAEGA